MRTNIDIDDKLMAKAMKVAGLTTKKDTVQRALEEMVLNDLRRQAIKDMKGVGWEGDLDAMRTDTARDLMQGFAEDEG